MVAALFVLSLAMILGGALAVVLGWDIVLLERGWAMVIAGSVCAGSGAVLLGLAVAVGRLGRIRSDLASVREDLTRLAPMPPSPLLEPASAVSAGVLAGGASEAVSIGPADDTTAADLPPFLRPGGADAATEERASRSEPEDVSDVEARASGKAADRDESRPAEVARAADLRRAEEPVVKAPDLPPFEPEDQADRVPPAAGPMPAPSESPEPVPAETPEAEREAPLESEPAPTVIGTYTSGDNRYVMFSDGSIEAETPDGLFRFDSLDELKEFIASGGERSSSAR
jgi:hypothetical protein